MADDSKPKRPRSRRTKAARPAKNQVEDAVVVEEVAADSEPQVSGSENEKPAASAAPPATADGESAAPVEPETGDRALDASGEAPQTDKTASDSVVETPELVDTAPEPARRAGVMALLLGGVAAAAIGAGALYFVQQRGWLALGGGTGELAAKLDLQSAAMAELQTELAAARDRIETLQKTQPDGAAIAASLAELAAADGKLSGDMGSAGEALRAEMAALRGTVTGLRARIEEVETQPIPKAKLPAEIVNAYDRQLTEVLTAVDKRFGGLQGTLDEKLTAMQALLDGKLAEIEAAQSVAAQSEAAAIEAAKAADASAALARIVAALDRGEGFAADLQVFADKAGLPPPGALAGVAEDGAPTLGSLMAVFPEAARAALTASTRDAASDGSVSPLQAFFRTQLGARSLEPREGDDADAVLSRAEAAVGAGDLDTALTEIAALPQVGQAQLADWTAQVETRRAALTAAAALAEQLKN